MTKPTTSYTPIAKNTTPYGDVDKSTTDYSGAAADGLGTTLESTVVTLGSLTVYLNGYATNPPPSQSGNKPQTSYGEI